MQHRNTARATLSAETHRWRFPVLAVTPGLTRAMLTYMSIGKHVVMYKMKLSRVAAC